MYNESPDEEETVYCNNKPANLFSEPKKVLPIFEDALKSMEYGEEKSKKPSELFLKRAMENSRHRSARTHFQGRCCGLLLHIQIGQKKYREGIESPHMNNN